ncbi:MAG: hypothetical protein METHP_01676 [Methanoregula sp. SKADARSKE-2]|jgi:hypothetical protein|nr:MAG: hypothetical protein METHP_01676 [Methanoregula sp. SKADARSKE-2]
MLCKDRGQDIFPAERGYDPERIGRIRNKIRTVFGSECAIDDYELLKRYTLSGNGDLVLIVRGFR